MAGRLLQPSSERTDGSIEIARYQSHTLHRKCFKSCKEVFHGNLMQYVAAKVSFDGSQEHRQGCDVGDLTSATFSGAPLSGKVP